MNDQEKEFDQFGYFKIHLTIFDDKKNSNQKIDEELSAIACKISDSNIYDGKNDWLGELEKENDIRYRRWISVHATV